MDSAHIVDDQERKRQVVRYVDFDDSELWQLIPEFAESTSYADFRVAVLRLYPGASDTALYSFPDLESIVLRQQSLNISSVEELAAYHRRFLSVSQYLIKHGRYTEIEQSRDFVRSLAMTFRTSVSSRLQVKFPDRYDNDPIALSDIMDAADYVFRLERSNAAIASPALSTPTVAASLVLASPVSATPVLATPMLAHPDILPISPALTPDGIQTLFNELRQSFAAKVDTFFGTVVSAALASTSAPSAVVSTAPSQFSAKAGPSSTSYGSDTDRSRMAAIQAENQSIERRKQVLFNWTKERKVLTSSESSQRHPATSTTLALASPPGLQRRLSSEVSTSASTSTQPTSLAAYGHTVSIACPAGPMVSLAPPFAPRLSSVLPSALRLVPVAVSSTSTVSTPSASVLTSSAPPLHSIKSSVLSQHVPEVMVSGDESVPVDIPGYAPPSERNFGSVPPRPKVVKRQSDASSHSTEQSPVAPLPPAEVVAANIESRLMSTNVPVSIEELMEIAPDVRQRFHEDLDSMALAAESSTPSSLGVQVSAQSTKARRQHSKRSLAVRHDESQFTVAKGLSRRHLDTLDRVTVYESQNATERVDRHDTESS